MNFNTGNRLKKKFTSMKKSIKMYLCCTGLVSLIVSVQNVEAGKDIFSQCQVHRTLHVTSLFLSNEFCFRIKLLIFYLRRVPRSKSLRRTYETLYKPGTLHEYVKQIHSSLFVWSIKTKWRSNKLMVHVHQNYFICRTIVDC